MNRFLRRLLVAGWLCLAAVHAYAAAPDTAGSPPNEAQRPGVRQVAPVSVDGRVLFRVVGITAYPADKRAATMADGIRTLAADPGFSIDQLRTEEEKNNSAIFAGNTRLLRIFDGDARLEDTERQILALAAVEKIKQAILAYREERSASYLQQSALYTLVLTLLFALSLWALHWLMRRGMAAIKLRSGPRLKGLQARSFGILSAEQSWSIVERLARATWWLAVVAMSYAYVDLALERFPWTRSPARWLLNLVMDPLRTIGHATADTIPNLVFIAVVIFIVQYLLRLLRLFFSGIEQGAVKLSGFEPEWGLPTYNLVRIGVIALALVITYPYIPGSDSDAFKGISIFAGIIFSIGSSSLIANTLAGYVLIYRKAFRKGDRVMIGKYLGDVVEMRLQVTILNTPKNEEVVIPNSMILGAEIVNYSVRARSGELILHSTVTIGYDAPWRQVEAMLLQAAERTPGLQKEPKPFVLKNALNDFYVNYEINVYCADASRMAQLYSVLHQNIVDAFNEYGVQIMSPHFVAQPDQAVVVPKDKWFEAPARRPADSAVSREN